MMRPTATTNGEQPVHWNCERDSLTSDHKVSPWRAALAPQVPKLTQELTHEWLTSIGPGGFEPPLTDPKSAVLPLDEGPIFVERYPDLAWMKNCPSNSPGC